MIILWILIGIVVAGQLFVVAMCVAARIGDKKAQRAIRDFYRKEYWK